ncbi:MAG: type IV pilus assembly protein PilM [Planctomycetia bacterium]|jgi:type IV pilus assembly protein PilM
MARSPYAWGIDIGKSSLKALRCRRPDDDSRELVAEAFDYIEYPTVLTQSDADPVELVRTALRDFMARNTVVGDRVAVSVPGQSGLSKFIKLPPIEAKKIPDIVRYEARQQIPFPLEQVIWDWQRLAGGMEEAGFVLDAEVAIFAMKREQVYKALEPLTAAGIEVDILQLSPIALANMVMFDQLPDPATIDPDKPPQSLVLVATGVDSTDVVVTNGLRIWQRSMPIGGSTFSKALVKDLKLTFGKAEHLKRNAVRAEDPKAVFKAMRPVFGEFAAELQRSLNYFTGADRGATLGRVLLLGNSTKLRGLAEYVGKQLQLDVQRLEKFNRLAGQAVLAAPAFRENRLAFGTAYGLALQAAGMAPLRTNLLPQSVAVDRLVEAKKPAMLAGAMALLAAALLTYVGSYFAWESYLPVHFTAAFAEADVVARASQDAIGAFGSATEELRKTIAEQVPLVEMQVRRAQTLDMFRAVRALLPHEKMEAANPADRIELHIDSIDCEYFPDLQAWFAGVGGAWEKTQDWGRNDGGPAAATPVPVADPTNAGGAAPLEAAAAAGPPGPQGPGWIVEIRGHHYRNGQDYKPYDGENFVHSTLIRGLLGRQAGVRLTMSTGNGSRDATVKDLGIGFPVVVDAKQPTTEKISKPKPGMAASGAMDTIDLQSMRFTVQFVWQPQGRALPPSPAAPPN